ncbi:DUF2513 domain-containing protein [Ligilactobacillus saerimneri]|uniref:DUF2513 domain-containing protein n=1 Tax=Ligilactobacillus saerimneri TaxID=228229 RepID=UPI0022A75F63|nr:DUF2513 domain-containing protein [Ligilactobacillus saerimneri]MCZ0892008.1 DUF2513 domain-containing protein [Ligilactobacillus saerimneri]
MKLDFDCLRNILLAVEELSGYGYAVDNTMLNEYPLTANYSDEVLTYHVKQLINANLFIDADIYATGFAITDLSFAGHNFVDKIRKDDNWHKVKDILKKASNFSSPIVQAVISGAIGHQLGF